MKSVAIFALHPIMYQTPIFSELEKNLNKNKKFDFKVFFGDNISINKSFYSKNNFITAPPDFLMDGYKYEFLKNWARNRRKGFFSRINIQIFSELKKGGYEVIMIHGYDSFTSWFALLSSQILGIKVIWRGEAVLKGVEEQINFKQIFKRLLLKQFFRICDAVMYSCRGNKDYLKFYSVEKDKLFSIPCAVNNKFFQEENKKYIVNITSIRSGLGIHKEDLVVLFSARFTSRKRPMDLLKAVNNIKNTNITILFVGDGPERENMEKYVEENKIKAIFTGFINQSQISKYYSIADINIVISDYDPSPKAMNEAMNFKLPIIVTEVVGTAYDLVKNNENGFIIKVGDLKSLSEKVSFLNQNREIIKRMGEKSFKIVQKWNYEEDVKGIKNAFEYVT